MKEELPFDIDKECIPLCTVLNSLKGIKTFESCCGHGKRPFRIWFTAENVNDLTIPAMACYRMYGGCLGWRIEVVHSESPNRTKFMLEGTSGESAYNDSTKIVQAIQAIEKAAGK